MELLLLGPSPGEVRASPGAFLSLSHVDIKLFFYCAGREDLWMFGDLKINPIAELFSKSAHASGQLLARCRSRHRCAHAIRRNLSCYCGNLRCKVRQPLKGSVSLGKPSFSLCTEFHQALANLGDIK